MRKPYKYTEEEFVEAVKQSISLRQVLHTLGLVEAGGNYHTAKRRIKKLGLDTSHFLGQAHLRGKTHDWSPTIPLHKILVKNSTYASTSHL